MTFLNETNMNACKPLQDNELSRLSTSNKNPEQAFFKALLASIFAIACEHGAFERPTMCRRPFFPQDEQIKKCLFHLISKYLKDEKEIAKGSKNCKKHCVAEIVKKRWHAFEARVVASLVALAVALAVALVALAVAPFVSFVSFVAWVEVHQATKQVNQLEIREFHWNDLLDLNNNRFIQV